jgi:predicted MFS family arabinose efflux permease
MSDQCTATTATGIETRARRRPVSVASPVATRARSGASVRQWLAVLAVTVGTFTVVTAENLPMGLLTLIAGGVHVPVAEVGLMVTVTGLVAACAAALLPVAVRELDRRLVLVGLIGLMVVANLLTAVAPTYAVLLGSRFLTGISIGGFWSLAAGLGVRLVPEHDVPRALSMIFFGAMAANVLGIPAGTLLGGLAGWRIAFTALAGAGLLLLVTLLALLPSIPASRPVHVRTLIGQLRTPAVRVGVIATFLLVSGQYGAFTFVSPILQRISHIHAHTIGPLLLTYGAAAIAGNFLAGAAAPRNVRRTIITVSVALAVILVSFPILGHTPLSGAILLILWGLAFGGLPVTVQTWILKAAPNATEAATGLNTFMFNLAIALGALSSSIVAGATTTSGVLWLGAILVLLTSVAVLRTPANS